MSQWANEIIASFLRPDVDSLIDDFVAQEGTKQIHEFRLEGERMDKSYLDDLDRPFWMKQDEFPCKYDSFTVVFHLGMYGNLEPDPYPYHPMQDVRWYVNNCESHLADIEQFDVFELCFGNLINAFVSSLEWKEKSWLDVVNDYQINGIDGYTREKEDVIINTVIKFQ